MSNLSCLTLTTPSGEQKQSESDNCVCGVLLSYPWKKLASPEDSAAPSWPVEPFSLWNRPVFISEKESASESASSSSEDEDGKDGWSSPLGSYCSEPSEADGKSLYDNYSNISDADEKWSSLGSYLSAAYHAAAHHAAVADHRAVAAEDAFGVEDAFGLSGSDQSAKQRTRGRRGGRQRSARRSRQQESKIFLAMQEDDKRRSSFNPCPHGV